MKGGQKPASKFHEIFRLSPFEKAEIASLMLLPAGGGGGADDVGPPFFSEAFGTAAADGDEAESSPSAFSGMSRLRLATRARIPSLMIRRFSK